MQINRQTYEEFFILYIDDELNSEQKRAVEDFIKENPDLAQELSLLKETIAVPDPGIIFEHKGSLYKEEDERKVIPFNWYRFAAAAIILLAFTIFGWLYLSEKQNPAPIIATVEKQDKIVTDEDPTKVEDPRTTNAIVETKVPAEPVKDVNPVAGKPIIKKTGDKEIKETEQVVINEPIINNTIPEPAEIEGEIVYATPEKEIIDVAVSAREINKKEEEVNTIHYAKVEPDDANTDMIYFANTTLPKKTKLRGVFRKASRFLDKVTSLQ